MKRGTLIKFQDLSYAYDDILVLKNINFDLPSNSITGLVGPNGSGKTTLLSLITKLIAIPTKKIVFSEGCTIGALVEGPAFFDHLSVYDNLYVICLNREISSTKIQFALNSVGLQNESGKLYKNLSYGLKMRLGIASCLIHEPSLIILDEPTNGLDPVGLKELREILTDLKNEGINMLIASHMLNDIQNLCTHVGILNYGELLFFDKIEKLYDRINSIIELSCGNVNNLKMILLKNEFVVSVDKGKNAKHISVKVNRGYTACDLNKWCFNNDIELEEIYYSENNFENSILDYLK